MPRTEIPEYVNEKPGPGQKPDSDTHPRDTRAIQLVVWSFGALCVIQVALNVSLRLTLNYSQSYNYSDCITTDGAGDQMQMGQCNGLGQRIVALSRDLQRLENKNTELSNMIQMTKEERDRLEIQLREVMTACETSLQCPAGWRSINCRCYYLSSVSKTWEESRKYCQSQGADLVVINSEQEQRALYRLNGEDVVLFWIGLRNGNGSFKWVDGSALTNQFWQTDQPKPFDGEDCVESYHNNPELKTWNDVPCEKIQRWLCEKALGVNVSSSPPGGFKK